MNGDCFQVAAQLQADDDTLTLVHGTVLCTMEGGTAIVGQRHWHAWVEKDNVFFHPAYPDVPFHTITCIDQANGNDAELPQQFYYKLAEVEDVRRYTHEEACILMLRTKHWGPWEEEA